jgi:3-hydroxyacyl-[acyl-carrier-protein] dehydratase
MLKLDDMAARHPEAFPFLLVDKILGAVEGERAIGLRNVTANDPLLAAEGREPHSMRRSLLVEAFAQLAAIVLAPEGESAGSVEIAKIDSMSFLRTPVPGDQVVMTVELAREGEKLSARCKAEIGGQLAAEGTVEIETAVQGRVKD